MIFAEPVQALSFRSEGNDVVEVMRSEYTQTVTIRTAEESDFVTIAHSTFARSTLIDTDLSIDRVDILN